MAISMKDSSGKQQNGYQYEGSKWEATKWLSVGVPMANYGELWRIMAKVFMANWAKLNCAIRHNSP